MDCSRSTSRPSSVAESEFEVPYGMVFASDQLAPSPLPSARGEVSEQLIALLQSEPKEELVIPTQLPGGDPLTGEDAALSLYCLYELHYRGWKGVSDQWEWHPGLLGFRSKLEAALEQRLAEVVGPLPESVALPDDLEALLENAGGPSLSDYLLEKGTTEQFQESAIHRSAWQLKEADPYTWAIPRLFGKPKAAAVEIQADEYGAGAERDMHQTLFAVTLEELGLNPTYHAYINELPGYTLAGVNVISLFGLHRRWLGACVGHLAAFEMTSVAPMGKNSAALRRLGFGSDAQHFYDVHVVADAHHQNVAAGDLASGLVEQRPDLAMDVLFGAKSVCALEAHASKRMIEDWEAGRSSLLGEISKDRADLSVSSDR